MVRRFAIPPPPSFTTICACGCEQDIPAINKQRRPAVFAYGHNRKGQKWTGRQREVLEPILKVNAFSKDKRPWNLGLIGFRAGYIQSEEHVRKRVRSILKRFGGGPNHQCPTSLEVALYHFLDAVEFDYHPQRRIGRCVVDAYLIYENIVVEADGEYWHRFKDETKRDAYLLSQGIDAVVHLSEAEVHSLAQAMA